MVWSSEQRGQASAKDLEDLECHKCGTSALEGRHALAPTPYTHTLHEITFHAITNVFLPQGEGNGTRGDPGTPGPPGPVGPPGGPGPKVPYQQTTLGPMTTGNVDLTCLFVHLSG